MLKLIRRNQKINLALALSDSNRAALAINCWKELMADFPDDSYFQLQLISSLITIQEYAECRNVIEQLPSDMAGHPQVHLALAEVEYNDGNTHKARSIVRELLDNDLVLPEWLNRAGNILLKCHAWNDAEQVFLKSLQIQPDNPPAYHGLSTAYWEQDRFEDAIRESRQVLTLLPSFSQARFTLAKSLQSIGKHEEAIDAFEVCLNAGYQSQETHGCLAALYRIRDPIRANYHQLQSGVC
jgi:tetratricopeptide (TPR) repeat protein